jgi:hypothetical protein
VRSQLNHYETLGVSPAAGSDEIARAFAREGSAFRPHAFGGLTELCLAYETLRDPEKRRAYDASIGIKREPAFRNFTAGARETLVAKGPAKAVAHPILAREPLPKPALPLGPALDSQVTAEPQTGRPVSPRLSLYEEMGEGVRPIDWRRAALVLGGVVTAACAVGGAAGWWSASAVAEASPPDNTVSIALPPATPQSATGAPEIAAAPVRNLPEVRLDRPRPAVAAVASNDRQAPAAAPAVAAVEAQASEADPVVSMQAAGEAPAVTAAAAPMPLPDRVVARTIERIGYACGRVASTTPVEGDAPGVYKVTCSSGQSYQAKPVNGRYRFRRWGRS